MLQQSLKLDSGANSWEKRVALTSLAGKGAIARYRNESGSIGPTWTGMAEFQAVEGQPASVRVP